MRKLDYLRSIINKSKSVDDIKAIRLPKEFRWKNDIEHPTCTVVSKEDTLNIRILIDHKRLYHRNPDRWEYESEIFTLHPRKGFDYKFEEQREEHRKFLEEFNIKEEY